MRILCLGGAGRITREAVLDLATYGDFEQITVADRDPAAGAEVVAWIDDPRVDFAQVDVFDQEATVATMRAYDIVLDGTTISLNEQSTRCIAAAGCHGLNLNGFGTEYQFSAEFAAQGKLCVPGFGMTPGTTNMMAVHASDQLDTVESVRVSHGAFRPIAFSKAITETTTYEYDPDLPGRVVFEDGEFIQVPPFARPREIQLPGPYGTHEQYIIPHSETTTLADYLSDKGVRLIEVRGTWPPANMRLVRALYEFGFMRNDEVTLDGQTFRIMDAVGSYLGGSTEGRSTPLYGYALHVEVIGRRDGRRVQHVLTHTHPASDGSVADWAGLRAYTRCVAIPSAVGVHLIAAGRASGTGALIPERAFRPADVFDELKTRGILIHEEVTDLPD